MDDKAKILLVDDREENLIALEAILSSLDQDLVRARSGEEALKALLTDEYAVILLDVVMPGMDGFETCRRLKTGPQAVDAPVIFMTGLGDPADVLRGLEAGGVDYVVKPINHEVLLARITVHALNARRMRLASGALDQAGRPVLAAEADGRVVWATPGAVRLLAKHRDPGAGGTLLPAAAGPWISAATSRPVSEVQPLNCDGMRLTCLGRGRRGEIIIQAHAGDESDDIARLQARFALTGREAEALLWLTAGKTNQEIAGNLGLSRRTVDKHLEQVLEKLGVDNRTAAALVADRFLEHARPPA